MSFITRAARLFGLTLLNISLLFAFIQKDALAAIVFDRIIDTDTTVGGGKVFFIGTPQLGNGRVVVAVATDNGRSAIVSIPTAGGTPKVLASTVSNVPGGIGTFTTNIDGYLTAFQPSNCTAPMAGTSDAVFVGRDSEGNRGLYAVALAGGPIRKLVNRTTRIPGGPVQGNAVFATGYEPCNVSVAGKRVVFDTGGGGVYQIMTDGTGLVRIADPNTPATKPPFEVAQFSQPTAYADRTVYVGGTVFGPYALYQSGAGLTRSPLVIGTANPQFNQFRHPERHGTNTVFWAALPNGNVGLFTNGSSGAKRKVFDLAKALPSGIPGTQFSSLGNGADSFVVDAQTKPRTLFYARSIEGFTSMANIVSSCSGVLSKVLSEGDVLQGRAVVPSDGLSRTQAFRSGSALLDRTALTVTSGRYAAVYVVSLPVCR